MFKSEPITDKDLEEAENNLVWLSTIDNPFSYFDEFENWLNFDLRKGYNCCALVARLACVSDSMSNYFYNREIERAVDQIIDNDPLGLYIKVRKGHEKRHGGGS